MGIDLYALYICSIQQTKINCNYIFSSFKNLEKFFVTPEEIDKICDKYTKIRFKYWQKSQLKVKYLRSIIDVYISNTTRIERRKEVSIIVIVLALVLLLILTLKKVPVPIAAIISVVFMAVFTRSSVLTMLAEDYMGGVAGFLKSSWLMILLGMILAKIMDVTGAAMSISEFIINKLGEKRVIPAVVLAGGLLTYGGIYGLGGVFAIYPIALAMFRKANLPRYLIPAAIASGLFTWANVIPGNPSMANTIAGSFLGGTNTMSAPLIGIVCGVLIFVLTIVYFNYEVKKARKKGLGFETDVQTERVLSKADDMKKKGSLPNPLVSVLPLVVVTIVLNLFSSEIWLALLAGVVLCILLFNKKITGISQLTVDATNTAAIMAISAAAITGIGSVVKAAPGFDEVIKMIMSYSESGGSPLAIFGTATTAMAGLCASGMTGLSTVLSVLAEPMLKVGVSADAMHRIGLIASVGLDSLPHSGGIVAIISLSGVSYKEGYKPVFVTTCVITLIALVVAVLMGMVMYG